MLTNLSHPDPVVDSEIKDFLNRNLFPLTGGRLFNNTELLPYACKSGSYCLTIPAYPGSKAAHIEWSPHHDKPQISSDSETRTLFLPLRYKSSSHQQEGRSLTLQLLTGHPLHPYTSFPDNYEYHGPTQRAELSESPIILKPAQEEGIKAAELAMERGDKSFLFVAPTGLGKSEVLMNVLASRIRKNKGKIHVVVVDQNQGVEQLKNATTRMLESQGLEAEVIQWGGEYGSKSIEELIQRAEATGKPIILATTIQSFKARLTEGPTPEATRTKLRGMLGTLVFDEAHHAGAEGTRPYIDELIYHPDSQAFFLGTTATPLHSEVPLIEKLFENRAFWANIDTANDYSRRSGKVDRDLSEIVDQLSLTIRRGELSPLENLDLADEAEFGDNLFVRAGDYEKSRYQLNETLHPKVVERFKPLVERHQKGFISTATTVEADKIAAEFQKQMPHKKFASFHSALPKNEQARIKREFEDGKIDFLVTVKKLDEAVDYPDMTLYLDLNRSVGPRQLLQRLGRVLRLRVGKESAEVGSFFKADEDAVKEKLILLEALLEEKFASGHSQNTETPLRSKIKSNIRKLKEQMVRIQTRTQGRPVIHTPEKVANDTIAFFMENWKLPTTSDGALYTRMHDMRDNPDYIATIQEWEGDDPVISKAISEMPRRPTRVSIGERGPVGTANALNNFVEDNFLNADVFRLPSSTSGVLSASDPSKKPEAALYQRLIKLKTDSEDSKKKFWEALSDESKDLIHAQKNFSVLAPPDYIPSGKLNPRNSSNEIIPTDSVNTGEEITPLPATPLPPSVATEKSIARQKRKLEEERQHADEKAKGAAKIEAEKALAKLPKPAPKKTDLISAAINIKLVENELNKMSEKDIETLNKRAFIPIESNPLDRRYLYLDWAGLGYKTRSAIVRLSSGEQRVIYDYKNGKITVLFVGPPEKIDRELTRNYQEYLK